MPALGRGGEPWSRFPCQHLVEHIKRAALHSTLHEYVAGNDLYLRRQWVEEVGSHSAIPIFSMDERLLAFREHFGTDLIFREGSLLDYPFLRTFLADFQPDAIVHLAEMPSAPYSMIDQAHAVFTQQNNVISRSD